LVREDLVNNKTIFGIAALAALVATPALAADMSVKAAPTPIATTWTGCYVNGGAGYGFFREDQHEFDPTETFPNATSGGSGWLGRLGGGCDYQFSPASGWGNLVVGAFADYDFMDLRGTFHPNAVALNGPEKESSAVGAGGRIGYLVTPQILAYANGGWSSTRFGGVTFINTNTGASTPFALAAHTFNGEFIGGGTEVAVLSVPGLYWRNEYRLAAYRAADLQFFFNGATDHGVFNHESKSVQTITTSLVWKFH
jgi:outer membrane immunogenic protein